MRFSKVAVPEVGFSYVSMIDIVFLILIFFLCASRFKQIERRLDAFLPPDGVAHTAPDPILEELTIFVKDNRLMRRSDDFNLRAMREASYYLASRDATPVAHMRDMLPVLTRLGQNRDQRVLIAPFDEKEGKDQLVPFFNIIRVVDACKAAGVNHIAFQAPAALR